MILYDKRNWYVEMLQGYFLQKNPHAIEMEAFSDESALRACLQKQTVDILVVTEWAYEGWMEEYTDLMVILGEPGRKVGEHAVCVERYQSADRIWEQIMLAASERLHDFHLPRCGQATKAKLWGFYSPCHGMMQTTALLCLARYRARNRKVLVISFDPYAGLSELLEEAEGICLSDCIYLQEGNTENWALKIRDRVWKDGNLHGILRTGRAQDIAEIKTKAWLEFLHVVCTELGYEDVLLDLHDVVCGKEEILSICDVYFELRRPQNRNSSNERRKREAYENELLQLKKESLLEKRIPVTMPEFPETPENFRSERMEQIAMILQKACE